MKQNSLIIFFFLLSLASAQAVTINNSTLTATGSNATVTFSTFTVFVDLAVVNSTCVNLYNVSFVNGIVTLNNSAFISYCTNNGTISNTAFLYVSSTSPNTINLRTNLTIPFTATITLSGLTGTVTSLLFTNPNGTSSSPPFTTGAGTVTFTVTMQQGVSTVFINGVPNTPSQITACSSSTSAFSFASGLIGLLLLVVLSLGVIFVVVQVRSGEKTVSQIFDWVNTNIVMLVVLGFVLIFAIVIIAALVTQCA